MILIGFAYKKREAGLPLSLKSLSFKVNFIVLGLGWPAHYLLS